MLNAFPVLRRFEKTVSDLAAMFEFEPSLRIFYERTVVWNSSSRFRFLPGCSLFFGIAPELCQNFARFFSKILSF